MATETGVSEEAVALTGPGRIAGVMTRGKDRSTNAGVLLLNAGNIHKIGPNRMYVTLARRLAGKGISCLRIDLPGVGDTVVAFDARPDQVLEASVAHAITYLRSAGATRCYVLGMCSSADLVFRMASTMSDLSGAVLINAGLVQSAVAVPVFQNVQSKLALRHYRQKLFSPQRWRRLLTDQDRLRRVAGHVFRSMRERLVLSVTDSGKANAPTIEALSLFADLSVSGVPTLFVYSEGSVTWDFANAVLGDAATAIGEADLMRLEVLTKCDHNFTPLWSQTRLMDLVVDWLARLENMDLSLHGLGEPSRRP